MADIWKVGQDTKAADFYENSKRIGFIKSDIIAAKIMANVCNKMAESYEDIVQDQNEYLVEINNELEEIELLQKELDAQILQQEKERNSILSKSEDEELSEEDNAKLNEIGENISKLTNDSSAKINDINTDIQKKGSLVEGNSSKKAIALDYGNTAIEKGTPLANTKDKTKSFWRKTFGGWNKAATREAGKAAVDAGNSLLEQVQTSESVEKEIKLKAKNKKV